MYMTDPEGGGRVPDPTPPPEKSQNIGCLTYTGPDPLKNHQAKFGPSSARQRNAIGPMMTRL